MERPRGKKKKKKKKKREPLALPLLSRFVDPLFWLFAVLDERVRLAGDERSSARDLALLDRVGEAMDSLLRGELLDEEARRICSLLFREADPSPAYLIPKGSAANTQGNSTPSRPRTKGGEAPLSSSKKKTRPMTYSELSTLHRPAGTSVLAQAAKQQKAILKPTEVSRNITTFLLLISRKGEQKKTKKKI
jgi:hypothetical protein